MHEVGDCNVETDPVAGPGDSVDSVGTNHGVQGLKGIKT